DETIDQLRQIASSCNDFILKTQQAADADLRRAIVLIAVLAAMIAIAAICVGISHHRSIVRPLRKLRDGVRGLGEGQFSARLVSRGDPEFVQLIDEFNHMAAELEDFYRRLEEKAAEKSKLLVRSERLASVGYLAAGVAHEINNPLNIISGYAELTS